MFPKPGDASYDPEGKSIRILPKIAPADLALVVAAQRLIDRMHPLNADEVHRRVESILGGLSGRDTDEYRADALLTASQRRDAMNRMGRVRKSHGLHPVPEDMWHLLTPEERGNG